MTEHPLAYLSQGKLHLHGDGAPSTVESAFGRSLRDRAAQIQHRHAWKSQGRGAQFMAGMMGAAQLGDPDEFRVSITGVSPGSESGELLYSLETDEISGIFVVDAQGVERRVFHTADFRVRHIALNPGRTTLAASIYHPRTFTSNIAVMQVEGTDFLEATEGDSIDLAPRWVAGSKRQIVFQSAGLGRDGQGRFSGIGPFTVQHLDLDSGEIECLAEDNDHDLLGPQRNADGALYYIRRPYEGKKGRVRPLHALKDTALFPLRMAHALYQYFNFFSMRYTGKPLATSKGAAQLRPDLKQMMIWGNLIDVDRATREDRRGDPEAPSLVPSSWELVRQSPKGASEVIAKSVLSFDIAADGALLYSNGSAVHRIASGGRKAERILIGKMIEQIAAL